MSAVSTMVVVIVVDLVVVVVVVVVVVLHLHNAHDTPAQRARHNIISIANLTPRSSCVDPNVNPETNTDYRLNRSQSATRTTRVHPDVIRESGCHATPPHGADPDPTRVDQWERRVNQLQPHS